MKIVGGFVLIVLGFLLGLIGKRLMESDASLQAIIITVIVLACAILMYFALLLNKMIWPDRGDWRASLTYFPDYLEGKQATKWRTGKQQQVGDSFTLDIRKRPNKAIYIILKAASMIFKRIRYWNYGKVRVIDKVIFMHGKDALDYPVRWRVILSGLSGILKEFEKADSGPRNHMSFTLEHPEKITFITIEIIEPRPNQYWSIRDIEIHEVRFFGKYWRRVIK